MAGWTRQVTDYLFDFLPAEILTGAFLESHLSAKYI